MGLLLCVLLCFLGRLDRLGRRSLLTADRPAVNLELRTVARRLDDQNVVLDADNAADKTTDGGDLITDRDGVTHIALLLVALALRTDQEKVEYDNQNYKRQKLRDDRAMCRNPTEPAFYPMP